MGLVAWCVPSSAGSAEEVSVPETRPRLFIHREDLGALRFRCGVDRYQDDPVARSLGLRFGSQRESLGPLRTAAARILRGKAAADDLWAPAMMHLVTGEIGRPDVFTEFVARELLDPDRRWFELDAVAAFDWCFDAIDPERRLRITDRFSSGLEPFDPAESPVNNLRFERKLVSLAKAIVLTDSHRTAARPEPAGKVRTAINLAGAYLEGPFVRFCQHRGLMPTSGGNGGAEETNLVLAVELWRTGTGRSLWPRLKDTLGRAMEHYFYADTEDPAVQHGFIHDDGSDIPSAPGRSYRGFTPAVAHAIAANTRDPIATWYAHRLLSDASDPSAADIDRYQWVRLLYGPLDQPEAARRACPLGRDFGGGWVAMRGGWRPGDTVVLFDAGQPFWRARQHFDAGQFQVYRKGRLTIDSGDDVTFEAITARDGRTLIAGQSGDWDNYFQATIAHNCITVADRLFSMSLYGRPWPASGNQRLIGHDYEPSNDDRVLTGRQTGRLIAFETNSFYTYAAADLTAAYWPQTVRSIERRVLFLGDGVLIVLDRLHASKAYSTKAWHLQLPAIPQLVVKAPASSPASVPGDPVVPRDLNHARQVHGVGDRAGIWELGDDESWLAVTQDRGRLFVRTLLPEGARRRVVGGPMSPRQIPAGPRAGGTYHGGEPNGYEHRLGPATLPQAPNASYVLGRPVGLGEEFGVGATWGRLDVLPADPAEQVAFLHLLVPTDADVQQPPAFEFVRRGSKAFIDMDWDRRKIHVELSLADGPPGRVLLVDALTGDTLFDKSLAGEVQPNLPIPGGATISTTGPAIDAPAR
ncbi:MAG TPA: heparinase II/III family protein [Phycisphaerae bacterium]|nr:heparinase II/III family protein [Phycisphaerae bacterium]